MPKERPPLPPMSDDERFMRKRAGDHIIAGSAWRHMVDKVKTKIVDDKERTQFRIFLKAQGLKGPCVSIYCTVLRPLAELELRDMDRVQITSINKITAGKYNTTNMFFLECDVLVFPAADAPELEEDGFPALDDEEVMTDEA